MPNLLKYKMELKTMQCNAHDHPPRAHNNAPLGLRGTEPLLPRGSSQSTAASQGSVGTTAPQKCRKEPRYYAATPGASQPAEYTTRVRRQPLLPQESPSAHPAGTSSAYR